MRKNILKNMQWSILVCTILLIAIGVVALFSATKNVEYDELKKQITWLIISIPVLIAIIAINYETIIKVTPFFYVVALLLLIGVLFTKPINGATSWYEIGPFSFQPAEFAKIFVTLMFASCIVHMQKKRKRANK